MAETLPAISDDEPRALSAAERRQRQLAPIKHGLRTRARSGLQQRDRRTRRLVGKMRQMMPWLQGSDVPACRRWAELECIAADLAADLRTRGYLDDKGEPRRLLTEYRAIVGQLRNYDNDLGMTPAARAALGVKVATVVDIARQQSGLERG